MSSKRFSQPSKPMTTRLAIATVAAALLVALALGWAAGK